MEIDILQLIDEVEPTVVSGFKVPLLGKVVLDQYELLNLIDKIRMAVPDAIVESKRLVRERENIIEQAEQIRASAEKEFVTRLQDHEVIKLAQRRAQEIVREAERRAEELLQQTHSRAQQTLTDGDGLLHERQREADRYSMEVLRRLETQLNGYLSSVRKGLDVLERERNEV